MDGPFAPGLLTRLPEPPRRVVIVRAKRIGDFLCATPAIRALRGALPHAEITLVAMPFVEDLAARSPHLDRFVAFPGFPGMAEQFFDARKAAALFARMQAEHFDLAIQMHGSGVFSNPFTLMLGARFTAGFVREGDGPGRLDAAFPIPEGMHEVRRLLALTTFLGAPARGEAMEMPLWPEDHAAGEALLAGADPPLIGLHPGAREDVKRWTLDGFAVVGRQLRRQCGGTVVLTGGPDERASAVALARSIGPSCRSLVGETTMGSLGAVIARLDVLVTNDSGPAHVAYALGTPTVCLFGSTDPAMWGPLDAERHRVLRFGADFIGGRNHCLTPADVVCAGQSIMKDRCRVGGTQ